MVLRSVCLVLFLAITGCVSAGGRAPDDVSGLDGPETWVSLARGGTSPSREAEVEVLLRKADIRLEDLLRIAELNNPEMRAAWNDVGD